MVQFVANANTNQLGKNVFEKQLAQLHFIRVNLLIPLLNFDIVSKPLMCFGKLFHVRLVLNKTPSIPKLVLFVGGSVRDFPLLKE